MRHIIIFLFFAFYSSCAFTQNDNNVNQFKKKNVVKEYKNFYKAANYSKAFEIVYNSITKYDQAANDCDLILMAMDSKYQLYLDENKKLFLNNNADTTKFFGHIYDVYEYGLKLDSLVSKSRVDLSERQKRKIQSDVSDKLLVLRDNLLSGGKYLLKKKKYNEAFKYLDMYLSTMPKFFVLSSENTLYADMNDSVSISKLAVHAAYGSHRYDDVIRYLPLAVKDSVRKELILEMGAKAAMQIRDSANLEFVLREGFDNYPNNDFFKANIIQFYHARGESDKALSAIDKCIDLDSLNTKYWKLKGNELLAMGQLENAKKVYLHIMDLNSYEYETASVLGNLFLKEAHDFFDSSDLNLESPDYRRNRNVLVDLYTSAQKYFEIAMLLKPSQPELWKEGLLEIYLKLNKGRELEIIESM